MEQIFHYKLMTFAVVMYCAVTEEHKDDMSAEDFNLMVLRSGLDREWLRTQGVVDWEFVTNDDEEAKKTGAYDYDDIYDAKVRLKTRLEGGVK